MTERVLLGVITGSHVNSGDLLVRSYTGDPSDIAAYGPLSDVTASRSFKLKVVRVTPKGAVVARIVGVTDRNAAEALKGTELYVDRARLPAASEGEFYHSDLIGVAAIAPNGIRLGEIVAVQNYGAGDILEFKLDGRKETELIPFDDKYVPNVDVTAKRVTIVMPVADDDEPAPQS